MSERRVGPLVLALFCTLLCSPMVGAQEDGESPDEDEDHRWALGIGGGLVDAGATTSPYLTASLRIRLGDDDRDSRGGIAAYIEPEIGYWDDDLDELGSSATDLLVGVNIGGAVALRNIEYFVGAGIGAHMLDTELDRGGVLVSDESTSLGVNAHFGVDVVVSDSMSIFGVGRIDLVDDFESDKQAKVYLGARFRF